MKSLTTYIAEKMIFNKSTATNYNYHPKSKAELQKIIIDRIKEEGNELDLNDIDTSALTDLSHLFDNTISELFADFNGNISKWDVSNVTDIKYCFGFCKNLMGICLVGIYLKLKILVSCLRIVMNFKVKV